MRPTPLHRLLWRAPGCLSHRPPLFRRCRDTPSPTTALSLPDSESVMSLSALHCCRRHRFTHEQSSTPMPCSISTSHSSISTSMKVSLHVFCDELLSAAEQLSTSFDAAEKITTILSRLQDSAPVWLLAEKDHNRRLQQGETNSFLLLLQTLAVVVNASSKVSMPPTRKAALQQRSSSSASHLQVSVGDGEDSWTAASPYFDEELNDLLCICLREANAGITGYNGRLALLEAAVTLELPEEKTVQFLCQKLTSRTACNSHRNVSRLVQTLRLVSLATKRCKVACPRNMDALFSALLAFQLNSRQSLQVLSALVRLRGVQGHEVTAVVSRRAASHASDYTLVDVTFALAAVAYLDDCHPSFSAATLQRCGDLAPQMNSHTLGTVCKYVGLLNHTRETNTVINTCGREIRSMLPLIAERAEQLLGTFSLRDARYVLRCFNTHRIRHALVFSKLTPAASDGDTTTRL